MKANRRNKRLRIKIELQRDEPTRQQKKAILVALEDEKSARMYFEGFRNELKLQRVVVIAEHQGSDPKSVIIAAKEANEARNRLVADGLEDKFEEVWVVFDTEGPQNQTRNNSAKNAIVQARALNFKTAVSNPSFEFWLLLHFEYHVQSIADGAAATKLLKKHITKYSKGHDCFSKVRPLTSTAIDRAKRIQNERCKPLSQGPCDCHPCTHVHELISELLGLD